MPFVLDAIEAIREREDELPERRHLAEDAGTYGHLAEDVRRTRAIPLTGPIPDEPDITAGSMEPAYRSEPQPVRDIQERAIEDVTPREVSHLYLKDALEVARQKTLDEIAADVTFPENVKDKGARFVLGAGNIAASVPQFHAMAQKWITNLLVDVPEGMDEDLREMALYKLGDDANRFMHTYLPVDERVSHTFWSKVASGFGSTGAFLGVGAATAAATGGASIPMMIATGAVGASAESVDIYERAKAGGASEEEALASAAYGLPAGAIEAVPIVRVIGRFNKATGGQMGRGIKEILKQGAVGSVEEATQEWAQTEIGNAAVRKAGVDEPKLMEDSLESGAVGGIVGFVANMALTAAGARRFSRKQLLTPEGAAKLREAAPGVARKLAAVERPTRRDDAVQELKDVAPEAEVEKWSAEERAQMADLVRRQEMADAGEVRSDTGQVGQARAIAQRGEAPRGEDIQRLAEARRAEAVQGAQGEVAPVSRRRGGMDATNAELELAWGVTEIAPPTTTRERVAGDIAQAIGVQQVEFYSGGEAMGFSTPEVPGSIFVRRGMKARETLGTTIHEAVHLVRHADPQRYEALRQVFPEAKSPEGLARIMFGLFEGERGVMEPGVLRAIQKGDPSLVKKGSRKGFPLEKLQQVVSVLSTRPRPAPAPREAEEVGVARPIGRPELANPALTPEGRQFVDTVDEARKQAGIPAKVTFAEMEVQAGQRLEADYAGERGRLLEFARKGGTIPAEHLDGVVARQIIRREELETIKTGDPRRLKELGLLIEAYRGTGTEYARGLAVRRDPVQTPEQRRQQIVVEAIVQPRQKDLKALEKAKRKGDEATAERIRDKTAKEHEQLRKDLGKQGIRLENIETYLQDEHQTAAILRASQTLKGDKWDAMYEWWNNSILGAVSTQMANITGNLGHMGWTLTGQRLTEAMVNTIRGNPKEAQWGEFSHMMAATLPGMSRAARNFWRSFMMELPVLERDFGKPGVTRFEVPRVTIRGTKGRIIRLPWRTLLAFDQLFKSFASEVETSALAYRRSKAAGLTGRELQLDVARQVMDPNSEARSESIATANRLAFMEPSEVGNALIEFRRKVPLVRYQIPFVTTPWNILKRGFRVSPAGSVALAWKIYKGMKTGTWEGVTPRIAEQMIGWAMFLALLSNDPEDPFITGAAEERERGPREMARRTYPPQSIRLPDGSWWSYARIEPFATAISLMVDFTNAFRSSDPKRIGTVPFTSVVGQIKNKTFMKGIGDFFRMFESQDVPAAIARWSSSFLVSWVPNIVRTAGRATRKTYPERAVWGKGTDWLERLGKRTLQRTELGILPQEPGIDLWGREQIAPKSPVAQTDWLWRMSMPIRIKQEDITNGDAVFLKWNAQHPDDPKYPGEARATYTVDGKRKYMTDEQYTQFLTMSGRLANDMVEAGSFEMEEPDRDDVDRLLGVISKARSVVKKGLVAEWTGGRAFNYERLNPWKLYRDYTKARRRRRKR